MRIGELAASTGVSPRMLRYYEENGLLASTRSAAGQRWYDGATVSVVARIRRLQDAGLPIRLIGQILDCACGSELEVEPCLTPVVRAQLDRIDADLARRLEQRSNLAALVGG